MHAEAESINSTRWCVATSESRLGMSGWLTSSQPVSKFKDSSPPLKSRVPVVGGFRGGLKVARAACPP
jgi:hypothetical protein